MNARTYQLIDWINRGREQPLQPVGNWGSFALENVRRKQWARDALASVDLDALARIARDFASPIIL